MIPIEKFPMMSFRTKGIGITRSFEISMGHEP
jgi:hypothetical protein